LGCSLPFVHVPDRGLVIGYAEEAVVDVGRGGVAGERDAGARVTGGFEMRGEFGKVGWDVLGCFVSLGSAR